MRYMLATLVLGPILLMQGRHVQRVTPRLPEPPGDRTGITGNGPDLHLLIIGDSAAAGVGASHQSEALAGQLTTALARDFRVHWTLQACTGHVAQEVVAALKKTEPKKFDVVVTSVGVNDATAGTGRKAWLHFMAQLIQLLESRHQAKHILISSVPPMHLFPALPQPLRWYLGLRAARLNNALQALLSNAERSELVPISFPPDPAYMASDGFHPGPVAYAEWGQCMATVMRKRLLEKTSKR